MGPCYILGLDLGKEVSDKDPVNHFSLISEIDLLYVLKILDKNVEKIFNFDKM